ncbi:MAG: signal peptide prediction [Ramlibacter sp.]|nr:signal peptide prediction [Ramlibacter sp.]
MTGARVASRALAYAWAGPCSALGLIFGLAALLAGADMQVRRGALEFSGGRLGTLLARRPFGFCAITLGHVILGLDRRVLAAVRAHEHVHVRQYEQWGPFFIPAYLLASLWQLASGRGAYRDNWFERRARAEAGCARDTTAGSCPRC